VGSLWFNIVWSVSIITVDLCYPYDIISGFVGVCAFGDTVMLWSICFRSIVCDLLMDVGQLRMIRVCCYILDG